MGAVLAIARIIGLATIWHLLLHYLIPSKTRMDKPQTKDEKQNKGINGIVEDIDNHNIAHLQGHVFNSKAFNALEWRKPILNNVIEALADPNTHSIGVYGSNDEIKDTLLQRTCRRVKRDKLFDMVLTATVSKKPNVNNIQEEIIRQLEFNFNKKSKDKRAIELLYRIKNEQKVLIVLYELCKSFDLDKVGIPFGADHIGYKILFSSTSEEMLSTEMHTQKNFMVTFS